MTSAVNKGYLIEGPSGFVPFDAVQKVQKDRYIHITFEDGTTIKCSTDHRFLAKHKFVEANRLRKGSLVCSDVGTKKVAAKRLVRKDITLFDPLNVANGHTFYSEGVISHNCDFVGSTQTLIHPDKLRTLVPQKPVIDMPITLYAKPQENRQYIVMCDCGEGVGLDYSAMQVIDASEKTFKQVAAYHDNKIKPHEMAVLIKQVAEIYNNALVFIEDASTGPLISEALFAADYKNLISIEKIKGKDQFKVVIGRNGKGRFGGKTTLPVKLLGCTELKRLIENDEMLITDRSTIEELESYSRQGAVYAAEDGNNDDLVTALMLFGWLYTLKEFRLLLDNALLSEDALKGKAETYQILNFMQKLNGIEQFESNGILWTKIS